MTAAACAHEDAAYLPWTADGEDVPAAYVTAMAEICDTCPVRVACSKFLRPAGISAGFWAGRFRDRTITRESKGAA
jgi:hypothetical protein